jgi:hypothetical protein
MSSAARRFVTRLLHRAGIEANGSQPWDIHVVRERFFRRALRGSLGYGRQTAVQPAPTGSGTGAARHAWPIAGHHRLMQGV